MAGRRPPTDRAIRRALLPNETQYQRQIMDAARYMGWKVNWHRPSQNRNGVWSTAYTLPGWPDLTLIRPPRLILAEIKGPRTPITPEQIAMLELLGQCDGIETYLWRSGKNDLQTEIVPILRGHATLTH